MKYVWVWVAFVIGIAVGSSGKHELWEQVDFYKNKTIGCSSGN